jgi:hypothetical protein
LIGDEYNPKIPAATSSFKKVELSSPPISYMVQIDSDRLKALYLLHTAIVK